MGFWGNLANEAGKKTGKAIGNAVFGKHAADQVIDVNGGISNGAGGQQDAIKEAYAAQEIEERRELLSRENEIMNLEFSDSDIQYNYRLLFKLIPMIESYYKQNEKRMYEGTRSKYESGLLMCQMLDPSNTNLILLQNKLKEWDEIKKEDEKKDKRKLLFGLVGLLIFLIACILVGVFA